MDAKLQTPETKRTSITQSRVWIDLVFFVGMVLVLAPQATGIPVHEWASFLIIIPFVLHFILDWRWCTPKPVNRWGQVWTRTNSKRVLAMRSLTWEWMLQLILFCHSYSLMNNLR